MKRLLTLLLALALSTSLSACGGAPAGSAPGAVSGSASAAQSAAGSAPASTGVSVRLGGLKGPTSMGLVKLLDDGAQGLAANVYDFQMAGSADELTPLLIKGELDILAAPVNLAAVLYGKTQGGVELLAVNTLGVLYLVENGETISGWADLKEKTILATGKGSAPEYTLRYLLKQNGLDPDTDVTIEWKSEPSEAVALLAAGQAAVAMLPQPYVAAAQSKLPSLRTALDLTKEWDALGNGSRLVTAGLIARTEFVQAHPEAVEAFLKEYAASAAYVNGSVSQAAQLVEKYGIVQAAVAEKAIPACNIVCLTGPEMRSAAEGYLQVLYDSNPKSVGGALPGDGFYYGA